MLISIIIPIGSFITDKRNIYRTLNECKHIEFEVLLIMDGASYKEQKEISEYISENNLDNVSLLNSNSRNPGSARNIGLDKANGDWIVFWDSDDIPMPEALFQMILKNQEINNDILVGQYETIFLSSEEKNKRNTDLNSSTHSVSDLILDPGIWRMAFRRNCISDSRFPNLSMAEDQVFLSKILISNKQIGFHNEIVYNYVKGGINQLTKNPAALKDLRNSLNLILDMFTAAKPSDKAFLKIFISKQFITLIKLGNLNLKFQAIHSIGRLPINSITSIILQVMKISINLKPKRN